jgi:hypothetical protein
MTDLESITENKLNETLLALLIVGLLSMAAKRGASLAGRKGPPVWLRNGLQWHHAGPGF